MASMGRRRPGVMSPATGVKQEVLFIFVAIWIPVCIIRPGSAAPGKGCVAAGAALKTAPHKIIKIKK